MKPKTTKEAKIQWLMNNPSIWERFPKPHRPNTLPHVDQIFRAMCRAGLYVKNVQPEQADIGELIAICRQRRRANFRRKEVYG